MNSGQDDFDKLRKLLALKRHEEPPPGYFDRLPNQIISRIKAGESTESIWDRLLPRFILRPAFAYGTAVAACVLLAFGANYALREDAAPNMANPMLTAQPVALAPGESPAVASSEPTFISASNSMVSSTNPVNPQPLFEPKVQVLPAGYHQ